MTQSFTTPDPVPAHRADASGATGVGSGSGGSGSGTPAVAKQQAGEVAQGAKDAGQQVAGEAMQQAGEVKREVGTQARDLLNQTRGELSSQAGEQQQRAAGGLRVISQELGQLARGESAELPGPATDIVQQVSQRVDAVAQWLESREPGDVLQEVQSFARQRPGAFLAVAAGAGLLVGRFARGVKDAGSQDDDAVSGSYGSAPVAGSAVGTTSFAQPDNALTADPLEPGYPTSAPATPGYYGPADQPIGTPPSTGGRGGLQA